METTSEPAKPAEAEVNPEIDAATEKKQRTIFIDQLRWPGSWMSNTQITRQLSRCLSYSAIFSRAPFTSEKHIKTGSVEIEFSSVEAAREAYVNLQKLVVDGQKTPLRVDDVFFQPASLQTTKNYFATPEEQNVRKCTIYAVRLPRSVDKLLLESIVGADVIQHLRIIPMPNTEGLHQAEIIAHSEEAASAARTEGNDFEIDDGLQSTVVKLLTPIEYKSLVKSETAAKPFVVEKHQDKENETPEAVDDDGIMKAPEVEEDEVLEKMLKHIEEERINWAELSTKEELYVIADAVSAEYKGLPDSILKPALLNALQNHLSKTDTHWMREHLEGIIKMWKVEVMSEVFFDRPSLVRMETIDYKPQSKSSKKQKNRDETQKQGRMMLGLGAFLQQTGQKIQTENGEFDVEEDEDGNYTIGGEVLSFETWGKITKPKNNIIRADPEKLSKKKLRQQRQVQNMTQEQYKAWKKTQINERRADLKRRHMQAGAMIEEDEEEEGEDGQAPSGSAKPTKELDEGEIDSDEEKKSKKPSKKRKKKNSDSSSSSSSSDSDSDSDNSSSSNGEAKDSRSRRKQRRKKDRKTKQIVKTPTISPFLRAVFDQRKQVVAALSPAHKLELANVLYQMKQKNSKLSERQQATMINAMSEMFAKNGSV